MLSKISHTFLAEDDTPFGGYKVQVTESQTNTPVRLYTIQNLLVDPRGESATQSSGYFEAYVKSGPIYALTLIDPRTSEVVTRVSLTEGSNLKVSSSGDGGEGEGSGSGLTVFQVYQLDKLWNIAADEGTVIAPLKSVDVTIEGLTVNITGGMLEDGRPAGFGVDVQWGDGAMSSHATLPATHDYEVAGDYTLAIQPTSSGGVSGPYFFKDVTVEAAPSEE